MNILIPMAGLGTRFKGSKYTGPKPLIDIAGRTMIERALDSFKLDAHFIFVMQKETAIPQVVDKLAATRENITIIEINEVTAGPACTCLLAKDFINSDEELIIANCDQIMFWSFERFLHTMSHPGVDASIVTYTSITPKNSYAQIDKNGRVIKVREKEVISSISLNGVHYWKRGRDFVSSAETMISLKDTAPNGEYYVAPSYNYLINNDKNVIIYHIANEQHHAVGTPEDLSRFLEVYGEDL